MKDLTSVIEELGSLWHSPIATCGSRVRVPTACGGCEYNPRGWTDTQKFALEVDKRYFGTDTYHKFKIAFTGCVIDCTRTREMDLGFQGMVKPELVESLCTGCSLCVHSCHPVLLLQKMLDMPYMQEENMEGIRMQRIQLLNSFQMKRSLM